MASSELSESKPGVFSALRVLVTLFFVALVAWAALAIFGGTSAKDQERTAKRYETLKTINADNVKKLTTYAWVDKAKGIVQIPIEDAIKLTVLDLQGKTPTACPAPAPTPAAEPAAAMPAATVSPTP